MDNFFDYVKMLFDLIKEIMKRSDYLGELELVVLLALDRVADDAYGMAVYDEIVTVTGREISAPTVYVTLSRLEKKGHVRSRLGRPTAERGGRAKRFFAITGSGRKALDRSREMLERLWGAPSPTRPPVEGTA